MRTYRVFTSGLLALNRALEETPGIGCEFAYPWVNLLLQGLPLADFDRLAAAVIERELHAPLRRHALSDPRAALALRLDRRRPPLPGDERPGDRMARARRRRRGLHGQQPATGGKDGRHDRFSLPTRDRHGTGHRRGPLWPRPGARIGGRTSARAKWPTSALSSKTSPCWSPATAATTTKC